MCTCCTEEVRTKGMGNILNYKILGWKITKKDREG